ncbi:sugar phosphate permease [Kerstersia gyiorum]|uniref:Sugar phosphate permease n=1 Tax=Kerstersia gyiorum TaxID=206506 RepID=A0A4Q7N0D0_9BURK|nr:MFS transporter [Kerstersia gyiorum]KAB0542687.1 MFS transporter [Kerstersia gyiorum]RZS73915.1 sugar phosphate permease [Kerstersia gyiorum]
MKNAHFDTRYEWQSVSLLALGFGLIGLDRWLLAPLFPFMMKDLGLGYQDLGNLIGALGIAWGVSAILMGRLADQIGRRKVLVISTIVFSLLSSISGLAGGLTSLLLIRVAMGISEGAFCPASVAAAGEASHPRRRGLNQGLQQSAFALFGLGFAPIIATQLLVIMPSWRYVFLVSALPGLLVAWGLYRVIREPGARTNIPAAPTAKPSPAPVRWSDLLRSRNVVLAMLGILCAMTGIFVIGAMMPSYLIDYLHLNGTQMGWIVSAVGFGGFLGEFLVPGASDLIGRRLAAVLAFIGGAMALLVFTRIGATPWQLFAALFVVSFFCLGLLALFTGPVAMEAAPPGLVAAAIGAVCGVGEIFGGGFAPAIAGHIAQQYGIEYTLYFAFGGIAAGALISLFLAESAPRKLRQAG